MRELIFKLIGIPSEKKGKKENLRDQINIVFKEELINLEYNNVGTYHSGSRTKK